MFAVFDVEDAAAESFASASLSDSTSNSTNADGVSKSGAPCASTSKKGFLNFSPYRPLTSHFSAEKGSSFIPPERAFRGFLYLMPFKALRVAQFFNAEISPGPPCLVQALPGHFFIHGQLAPPRAMRGRLLELPEVRES